MGRLDAAILNGTRRTFRELVEANEFWSFNGVVGMPDAPLATLALTLPGTAGPPRAVAVPAPAPRFPRYHNSAPRAPPL